MMPAIPPPGATPESPGSPDAAADRRRRAERAVRGAFAGTLALEGLMVLFVPRAIAQSGPGLTAGRLTLLLVLVGLLWLTAGLQRRRFGLPFATMLQFAVIATGVFATAMYVLGVIFGLIWIYLLRVRRDVLGR
jgi:hypothetical protein